MCYAARATWARFLCMMIKHMFEVLMSSVTSCSHGSRFGYIVVGEPSNEERSFGCVLFLGVLRKWAQRVCLHISPLPTQPEMYVDDYNLPISPPIITSSGSDPSSWDVLSCLGTKV